MAIKRRNFIKTGLIWVPAAAVLPVLGQAPFRSSAWRAGAFGSQVAGGGGGSCNTSSQTFAGATTSSVSNSISYNWISGSFTATETATICKVVLRLKKTAAPTYNMTVRLYNATAAEPTTPIGGADSTAVNAATVTGSEGDVTFQDFSYSVTNTNQYAWVLKLSFEAVDLIDVHYGGGASEHIKLSGDSGVGWDEWDNRQIKFTNYKT
jgi:hypothetical protein